MSEWPQRPGFDPASQPAPPAWAQPVDYAVADPSHGLGAAAGRRPGRRLAVGVVGVLALLATGLAVTQLAGADGAGSPEEAVQAFFDAVDDEDALGVLESLAPTERDLLVPSVGKLADQLERVEVSEDVDLQKVGGVDLEVTDLVLRTKGLHPDVAAVEVTGGTIAVAAKLADLPLGRALSGALEEEGGLDLDEPLDESGAIDLTLVTVRSGDGWHVSVLYSLAEMMRAGSDAPVPAFGNGIPARGADSPTAAVEAMVAAFNDRDYPRMIELTPPDSMAVLHDYGPGLLAAVDDGDDGDRGDDGFSLDDVELGEPEGAGDTRRLPLEGYRLTISLGGEESMSYVYDGTCMTSTMPNWSTFRDEPEDPDEAPESTTRCPGEAATGIFDYNAIFPPAGPFLFGPGVADVVVVERDGAWYVDPARSIIETILLNVDAMSPAEAERMVESLAVMFNPDDDAWYASMPADMYERCPEVDPPADDASFEERKEAGRRCTGETFGAVGGPDVDDDRTAAAEPYVDCYELDTAAEREACLLARGDKDAVGDIHEMACHEQEADGGDAAVEACLQGLVDKGEISAGVVVRFRCEAAYTVPDDPSDQDFQDADDALERCMSDAGFGREAQDRGAVPASTLPAPTTTTG